MTTSYAHKVRVRICGLLINEESILLVQLHSPVTDRLIWTPPGGKLEFGETMHECLEREYAEETGLEIEAGHLMHINEMISAPFHALEFFFSVRQMGGSLKTGNDPERAGSEQLLKDVQWKSFDEVGRIRFAPESLARKIQSRNLSAFGDDPFWSAGP